MYEYRIDPPLIGSFKLPVHPLHGPKGILPGMAAFIGLWHEVPLVNSELEIASTSPWHSPPPGGLINELSHGMQISPMAAYTG